jgi:hypothetical protein
VKLIEIAAAPVQSLHERLLAALVLPALLLTGLLHSHGRRHDGSIVAVSGIIVPITGATEREKRQRQGRDGEKFN